MTTLPGGRALGYVADTTLRMTRAAAFKPLKPGDLTLIIAKTKASNHINVQSIMNNRLQLCHSDAFNVVIVTDHDRWSVMRTGWSMGAEPGNWVRRSRGFQFGADETDGSDDVDRSPEGIVISSSLDPESDRMEFLIHWFR